MKKCILLSTVAAFIMAISGCVSVSTEWEADLHPGNYEINYGLNKVLEIDPVNVSGIDVRPYFDFFDNYRMKLSVEDSKISYVEFEMGDVPFSAYGFTLPTGKTACYFDNSVLPNVLRLQNGSSRSATDPVIATLNKGEFFVEFQLDYQDITYRYYFKTME